MAHHWQWSKYENKENVQQLASGHHAMKYHSVMKRDEDHTHAPKGVTLETMALSERSQSQKAI
jgi:hypothetical protein